MDKANLDLNFLMRHKNFVVAVLFLVLCGWGLFKFAVYYDGKVKEKSGNIEKINKKLKLIEELSSLQEKISNKRTVFFKDAREFFVRISSLADNSGIEITSTSQPRQKILKEFKKKDDKGIYIISIDLKITGRFENLIKFLNSFKTAGKSISVKTMEITNNNSQTVNVKMHIRGDLLKL